MSHWYDKQGAPQYEVKGKKGLRPSTLRDARKFGWVPSVSTVWGDVVIKPMLNKWIQAELMEALWTETHSAENMGASGGFPEYEKLARSRFNEKQQKVMGRGTMIHDYLEKYFSKRQGEIPSEYLGLCQGVALKLQTITDNDVSNPHNHWRVEESFSHHSGYGGKIDLCNDEWVVDFKTKEFGDNPNVKKMVYDDYGVQLAAYDQGLPPVNGLTGSRRLLNLFIDVGSSRVLEWEHEDSTRFRGMFNHALELWKLIKKYNPEWHIM